MPTAIPFSTPEIDRQAPMHPSERLAFVAAVEALNFCTEPGVKLDHFDLHMIVADARDGALTIWLNEVANW